MNSNNVEMITKEKFSKEVDDFILETNSDVMSAVIKVAEKRKIEIESISKFLNPAIKVRLEAEALKLRLIRKKPSLPL